MPEMIAQRYVLLPEGTRSGAHSVVRKGIDSRNGDTVAVKFVNGPNDSVTRKVFQREISALKSLSHPNIIRLRDSGTDDTDTFYVVLDWIERSFADVLQQDVIYEWRNLYETIAAPLASALSYAHLKHAEHRDIKPANVLVNNEGAPLLADFGIAKLRTGIEFTDLTVAGFRSGPYARA